MLFTELASEPVGVRVDEAVFVATVMAFFGWHRAEAENAG